MQLNFTVHPDEQIKEKKNGMMTRHVSCPYICARTTRDVLWFVKVQHNLTERAGAGFHQTHMVTRSLKKERREKINQYSSRINSRLKGDYINPRGAAKSHPFHMKHSRPNVQPTDSER